MSKLLQRERNKSQKKFWGPAGNRTQDLLNASQALLPLIIYKPLVPVADQEWKI